MGTPRFERARSASAKQVREEAILTAARILGTERSVREVTLTDIADAVTMHKSAMLRYFETREQIFLELTAEGWQEWSAAIRGGLGELGSATPATVASTIAESLAARPLFCDLLAQAPLNLERNVSLDSVRKFKLIALGEVAAIGGVLRTLIGLNDQQAADIVATATSMAGAFWQMAAPGTRLQAFYREEPQLAHAIVDVAPQLTRILESLLVGFASANTS